jgi:GT2 family glycosyltransferase
MNILSLGNAHDNFISRLIGKIETRNKGAHPGFLERLILATGFCAELNIRLTTKLFELFTERCAGAKGFPEQRSTTGCESGVSVIIVNWNGGDLLSKCLNSLRTTFLGTELKYELIIVDNGSTDNSEKNPEKHFEPVKLIKLDKNTGFGKANNLAVPTARYDKLLLLNNDVFINRAALLALTRHFEKPDVFAVSPKALHSDGSLSEGHSWCELSEDGPQYFNERQFPENAQVKKTVPTLYAFGGCAMVRKDLFLELGGFDSIYNPFYWEDNDLSFMALKRGYQVLYDPGVSVIHDHGTTSAKLSKFYLLAILVRNETVFLLKNINDRAIFRSVRNGLKHKIRTAVQTKDYSRIIGYILTSMQLPVLALRRIREIRDTVVSDTELFETMDHVRKANEIKS